MDSMDKRMINSLLEQYPTPFYVFEEGVLKERIRQLRRYLPEGTGLCFAVKANPYLGRFLGNGIDALEICSPGEMHICHEMGIDSRKYVLSGVYKDEASMRFAFEHGLCEGMLTVESATQFDLIRRLACEYKKHVRLLFRLTAGSQFGITQEELLQLLSFFTADKSGHNSVHVAGQGSGYKPGHAAGQGSGHNSGYAAGQGFGYNLVQGPGQDHAANTADCSADMEYLEFAGIQFFSGTQKTSNKKHRRELALLDDTIDLIRDRTGLEVSQLEYGPGFPASYFVGETFDENAYMAEFSSLLSGMRNRVSVMLEIGRGIAATCGSLLSRVVDIKKNQSGNYAILDTGIHHLTYFGQFMAMKHPVCEILPAQTDSATGEKDLLPEQAVYMPERNVPEVNMPEGKTCVCHSDAVCISEQSHSGHSLSEESPSEESPSEHSPSEQRGAAADESDAEWNLCGSLCTTNDLLVKKLNAPGLGIGDVVIFRNTGAYSMTEGISLFLSRDLPAVVWLGEDGTADLLRPPTPVWELNAGLQKTV